MFDLLFIFGAFALGVGFIEFCDAGLAAYFAAIRDADRGAD